jgi:hypothetical protein
MNTDSDLELDASPEPEIIVRSREQLLPCADAADIDHALMCSFL